MTSHQEFEQMMAAASRVFHTPGTVQQRPGVYSDMFWLSISDAQKEGVWTDFYRQPHQK